MSDGHNKTKNGISLRHTSSAAIAGVFKGKVSNFNQNIIIGLVALLILIGMCLFGLGAFPEILKPVLIIAIFFFFGLILTGAIRHCFIKPEDELPGGSALICAENKVVELKNLPNSLLSKSLIEAVCSLRFLENEPPVGLIEGDVTDSKSVRMLNKEERQKLKEEEHKAILEHQARIQEEIKKLQVSTPPLKQNS